MLKEIGAWLKVHGESVYGTRTFTIFGYGTASASEGNHGGQSATTKFMDEDIRFTLSKDNKTLHVFFLGKPDAGERIRMCPLGMHRYPTPSTFKRITLLGTNDEVKWELTTNHFYLTMPNTDMNDIAFVFKFELE